jgi:Raf kinase inhibitor-like YbhB/YbcL family protein
MLRFIRRTAVAMIALTATMAGCSSEPPQHTASPSTTASAPAVTGRDASPSTDSANGRQYSSARLAAAATPTIATPMTVTSTTFQSGATIPTTAEFAGCGGRNQSPQLSWSNFPPGTKSFVITLFDPDAPTGTGYWHWVVFNVPASVTSLPAGAGSSESPAPRAKSGYTDFGFSHYGGPCPPNGDPAHRYIFTVYALDVPAIEGVGPKSTAATVMFSLRGHLLAQGSLEGRFAR